MQRHHKTSLRAHISSATSAFFWGIIWKSSTHLAMFSSISSFRNTGRPSKLGFPTLWKTPCWKKKKRTLNTLFLAVFSRHITDSSCAGQKEPKETAAHEKNWINTVKLKKDLKDLSDPFKYYTYLKAEKYARSDITALVLFQEHDNVVTGQIVTTDQSCFGNIKVLWLREKGEWEKLTILTLV